MTILTKPILRELPGEFDRKSWLVILRPWGLEFRAKRTKRVYPITWHQIWNRAMLQAATVEKQEKLEKRKANHGG